MVKLVKVVRVFRVSTVLNLDREKVSDKFSFSLSVKIIIHNYMYYNSNSILNALKIIIIILTYYCCPCVLVSIRIHDCQDVNVHVIQHLCDFRVPVVIC